jgi:hypothetical protein
MLKMLKFGRRGGGHTSQPAFGEHQPVRCLPLSMLAHKRADRSLMIPPLPERAESYAASTFSSRANGDSSFSSNGTMSSTRNRRRRRAPHRP